MISVEIHYVTIVGFVTLPTCSIASTLLYHFSLFIFYIAHVHCKEMNDEKIEQGNDKQTNNEIMSN